MAIVAPRMRWPLRAAAWLIAAVLVVVAVRRIDFSALGSALRGTAWGWVVLATVCAVVGNTLAQTRRWQALLEPIPHRQRASFFDLARVSLASGAVSSLLPARAGEALRVIELKRRRGYPATTATFSATLIVSTRPRSWWMKVIGSVAAPGSTARSCRRISPESAA